MTVRDALAERFAIMAANAEGAPADQVTRWAYADVAKQYIDRARKLPAQLPADPRVRAATQAVRRCLSPRRDAMVGPKDVAVEALEALARVLDVVEVTAVTIYLSNWSSHKSLGHHGPGRKLTIMARPRKWEKGDGVVPELVPREEHLLAVQSGAMGLDRYREAYKRGLYSRDMSSLDLRDGDTLCCACSRAQAAQGKCHRVWAAEYLRDKGYRVVLDGEVTP